MKITKLEAENILRLKAVRIDADGKPVVLGGENGAGKSSVLAAIQMALGGKKNRPVEPLRKGAKKGHVLLETEDIIVLLKLPSNTIEVKAKDGSRITRPQELLDKLFGSLTFDPLAFERMEAKKQAEVLRQLAGLDFSKEEAKRDEAYKKRTDVGRDLRRLQAALEKLPEPPAGTPDVEASVAELATELERRQSVNAANAELRQSLEHKRELALKAKAEIDELEARLAGARERFDMVNAAGRKLAEKVKTLVDEDLDEVKQRIATAEQANAAVRAKLQRADLEKDLEPLIEESERLTSYINQIDEVKADAIAKAKYPVEGLEVTDDGVRLGGVPFEQASQAERLRASFAIGAAAHPGLQVMLVRDGALLDAKSLQLLGECAAAADIQPWVEVVGDRKEVTVLISDGEVAEDRTARQEGAA